jgi:hypothetical protein
VAALLRALVGLCLLRRGPQDLPYSPLAVVWLVAALLAVQLGFSHAQGLTGPAHSARVLVTLIMLLGITPVLLERRGLGNRMVQTLTALAGSSLYLSLATLPIASALAPHLDSKEPPPMAFFLSLAAVFLLIWKVRVEAAIWRQALDITAAPALMLTLGLMLVEFLLMFLFLPAPATVAVPAPG